MSSQEIADIKEIKAELGRIKSHMDIFKGYGKTLDSIENALIGNTLNGFNGIVHKVDEVNNSMTRYDIRLDDFEKFRIKAENEMTFAKWVVGIIFVTVIGATVNNYFTYQKTKDKVESNTVKIKVTEDQIDNINDKRQ